MKIIKNQQVCNGCKFSSLHYCSKFNQTCLSVKFDNCRYQLVCDECKQNDSFTFGFPEVKEYTGPQGLFRVPGLKNLTAIKALIEMRKYYPECFYENRRISAIYDAFPGAIWNGRQSNFIGNLYSVEDLEILKQDLESLHISLNLTWNNHLIQGTDVYDKFCNVITNIFHNGKHSITVASLELYSYLKEKYPNYTYYQSAILGSKDMNFIQHSEFDMYVLNRTLNNNWDKLLQIPPESRKQIELLCNDSCTPFCNRAYHYNLDNQFILNRENPPDYISNYCSVDHDFINFNNERWPITIKSSDIDTYINNGFTNFKLCSRGDPTSIMILKTIQYLVKPDYHMDAFIWAINGITMTEEIYKIKEKSVKK